MEIFEIIKKHSLTPNQLYVLFCIKEKTTPVGINLHQELRTLTSDEWVKQGETITLEQKAFNLLEEVGNLFKVLKKKNNMSLMGDDHINNVEKYNLIFPKVKIPTSGMYARGSIKNLETVFKWFFATHNYSWEIVFKATELYVDECERNNYKFMRTSQYFVKKQDQDKTILSKLADYCAIVESGEEPDIPFSFPEKIY